MGGKLARCEGANIKKLFDLCNGQINETAYKMGVYPSTVSNALREGEATVRIDNMARMALNTMELEAKMTPQGQVAEKLASSNREEEGDTILFAILVPSGKQSNFYKLMMMMGLEPVQV